MKRPLIFVGSRNEMPILALIAELNNIEILGILDYHYYGNTDYISGIPVIGDERWLLDNTNHQAQEWLSTCDFFPANWWTGSQQQENELSLEFLRQTRIAVLEKSKATVINLIHPNTSLYGLTSKYADYKIGKGTLVYEDCHHSVCNVKIGNYCVFGHGSHLAHNVTLGNNVIVASFATLRNCSVGDNSYIGYGSYKDIFRDTQITIGRDSTVWATAKISKDIPNNSIFTHTGKIFKKTRTIPLIEV
jgi:carbonic anhydrase/acetyltransferase-like protein (isoleucine patch superfamily)